MEILQWLAYPILIKPFISFTSGNLQTTYQDATVFIPAIAKVETPSLASLGNIKFKGNFTGTISKFKTSGTYSTNLGGFSTDLTMELPAKWHRYL